MAGTPGLKCPVPVPEPVVDRRFMISKFRYPANKFKDFVGDEDSYDTANWPLPNGSAYKYEYGPTYVHITQEIESSIPDISVISGIEYDHNDWVVHTISRQASDGSVYSWSYYDKRILIYYDGHYGREIINADGHRHLVPIPTRSDNLKLFPEFFSMFKVHDVGYRWGVVYSMENHKFLDY